MRAFVIGAGASKAYNASPTKCFMPIACDFFQTFMSIPECRDCPWVRVGNLINYLKYETGANIDFPFANIEDIEKLHSDIGEKLRASRNPFRPETEESLGTFSYFKAFEELRFLFTNVINTIQDGPVSKAHIGLAKAITPDDVIITFNWDTLIDRVLWAQGDWTFNGGYHALPKKVFDNGWGTLDKYQKSKGPLLLKLHGSTNWLAGIQIVGTDGGIVTKTDSTELFAFLNGNEPYPTYDGRWWRAYQPLSYGYYPPNLPSEEGRSANHGYTLVNIQVHNPFTPRGSAGATGVNSEPLIIPPVQDKSYNFYGELFRLLWEKAEECIAKADDILIIGYSFPRTDLQAVELFLRALKRRTNVPNFTIVNPSPDQIYQVLSNDLKVPPNKIRVIKEYFTEEFDIALL